VPTSQRPSRLTAGVGSRSLQPNRSAPRASRRPGCASRSGSPSRGRAPARAGSGARSGRARARSRARPSPPRARTCRGTCPAPASTRRPLRRRSRRGTRPEATGTAPVRRRRPRAAAARSRTRGRRERPAAQWPRTRRSIGSRPSRWSPGRSPHSGRRRVRTRGVLGGSRNLLVPLDPVQRRADRVGARDRHGASLSSTSVRTIRFRASASL
jgi:hypothetical protein